MYINVHMSGESLGVNVLYICKWLPVLFCSKGRVSVFMYKISKQRQTCTDVFKQFFICFEFTPNICKHMEKESKQVVIDEQTKEARPRVAI